MKKKKKSELPNNTLKIPHTGDKASLNRWGEEHQYQKNSANKAKLAKKNYFFRQQFSTNTKKNSSVRQNLPKKQTFLFGHLTPFINISFQIWDHFFPFLLPKDSKSLRLLDIRLHKVEGKRRLNGTSKSEQANTQTHTRTNRPIESMSPEGRYFENPPL